MHIKVSNMDRCRARDGAAAGSSGETLKTGMPAKTVAFVTASNTTLALGGVSQPGPYRSPGRAPAVSPLAGQAGVRRVRC
jgi:hypothetical protein